MRAIIRISRICGAPAMAPRRWTWCARGDPIRSWWTWWPTVSRAAWRERRVCGGACGFGAVRRWRHAETPTQATSTETIPTSCRLPALRRTNSTSLLSPPQPKQFPQARPPRPAPLRMMS